MRRTDRRVIIVSYCKHTSSLVIFIGIPTSIPTLIPRMEASADLHDVRDCLGHAHITTTSRYVRSTPVRLAQALARMEAAAETLVDADEQPHLAAAR